MYGMIQDVHKILLIYLNIDMIQDLLALDETNR